jgi:hypothetical protein
MGTDIHLFVERRVNGEWLSVDKWTEEDGYPYVAWNDGFYKGCNYDLFAILADVRNGYGFAGCDTGDCFNPIDAPRGLPDDVSPKVEANSDHWGIDGHSHSWFTLKELLNFDWNQSTKHRGYIPAKLEQGSFYKEDYAAWSKHRGHPASWGGGVFGKNIVTLAERDYPELQESGELDPARRYFVRVEWREFYHESAEDFLECTLPKLKALDPDPENVRVVFFFDN